MDIVGIFEALDTQKEGFIFLEVLQNFIEKYKSDSSDSQVGANLDEFNKILSKKAHSDGRLLMEDFEAAVEELEGTFSQKSSNINLTPTDSVELQSSQETLVEPKPSSKHRTYDPPRLEKSPSLFSKDDSNDTHSDSGVHDCVNSLDQVIADNEDSHSLNTSPRATQHVRGSSFGASIQGEVTDNEEYEDYGESENDYSLRSGDGPPDLSGPPMPPSGDVSPPSDGRLLKPPPHPGSSALKRPDSARGTWPRRRQRSGDFPRDNYAGPWGPVSATRQARDLYCSSLNGSPYGSYSEGLGPDVSIGQFEDIQEQIAALRNQFTSLSSTQLDADHKQKRLFEENRTLHKQVHSLEEQLKEVESKSTGSFDSEKQQLREKMERLDRDRSEEVNHLRQSHRLQDITHRLHVLETETAEARLEAMRYKAEAERLKLEKIRAEERLEDAERHVQSMREERERYLDIHKRELECLKKERDHANHRLEDFNRQMEEGRMRSASVNGAEFRHNESVERFREAQELVKRLTAENKQIREQLEETQAELLTRSLEQGRSLVARSESSLAAELESCTKDESSEQSALDALCDSGSACVHALERKKLMEMLVREKDANQKLRGYIDNILTRIMEKNPAILEV